MARLRAIEEIDWRHRLSQDSLVQFRLWRRRIIAAGKAAVVIYLIATPSLHPCRTSKTRARKQSKPALHGLYSIDRYTRDGQELALNGSHRWTSAATNGVSTEYQFFGESSTAPRRRLRSRRKLEAGRLPTHEQLVDELYEKTFALYELLWSACTRPEKLLLVQLAQTGLVNPTCKETFQELAARG